MKTLYALLIAAAGAPQTASAQTEKPAPAPYQSAFAGYHRTPDLPQTPDLGWRHANREVGAPGPAEHSKMAHDGAHPTPKDAGKPVAQPHMHKDH